ncbi:sulfotransferase [Novosphingobium sp. G106]|uniref:sulfotransferase family protein n=1 Tax=Novosphingobium sp. G106 TaxID=2849500 RepID=UPI0020C33F7F|nr:sulfotransferase [Novosphingobium sp. G106]
MPYAREYALHNAAGGGEVMTDPATAPRAFRHALDQLHAAAAGKVGYDDFGSDDYREGLDVLLQSMDYDPSFSEQGRAMAWAALIEALGSRAVAHQSMAQNPRFKDVRIVKPIVITGVPRTGTTALHKLLAVDPRFQGLEKWLLTAPMPRPPRESWPSHQLFQAEVASLAARWGPQQRAAHNIVADEVDECIFLQRQSFVSNFWNGGWSAATYDAWWQAQDERNSARYVRKCIQLIGSNDPERRWLLKNPSHILHLDRVFEMFPDACIIQTHRDPAKAIPSLCALLMHSHAVMELGRTAQRARNMCEREVAKWAKGVREAEGVRARHPTQVLDVMHSDFHSNPIATVQKIYAFVGLEFTPEVEARMAKRIEASPENSHGAHRYDVRDFGLTEGAIRDRFGDYVERYDLALRSAA